MDKTHDNSDISWSRPGVVLLVTLVLLVVLATLGYTFSERVASQRHRDQYIIDYSNARYGCDSAVKYALATMEGFEPVLVSRPNEPDFSDLFALDEVGIQELLEQWSTESKFDVFNSGRNYDDKSNIDNLNGTGRDQSSTGDFYGLDSIVIRGPYGPTWPFVTEPAEFEIGSAKVRIEIEDENAKYPLGWAMMDIPELDREIQAGFETFCEMAGMDFIQINALREQLKKIGEIKPFQTTFKTITKTVRKPVSTPTRSTGGSSTSRTQRNRIVRNTISATQQISDQTTHFAKMFNSSLIDKEPLEQPTIVVGDRKEYPLKYIGLWGTRQVNINTAPRHVLEAAFIFGGYQVEIAEEIIRQRQQEPFANIDDLKDKLSRYSESIEQCEQFITTESNLFTIRITSTSGVASASSLIAITKEGDKVTRIAVING